MSKRVQMIGFTAAAMESVTGLQREIMIDMTNWVVTVHDGTTLGGHPLALASLANAQVATDSVPGTMSAADKTKLDQYPSYGAPLVLARGAVGAVAYAFTSDTATGIWSAGAGVVNISSAGSEIVRVNSTGVGIKQNNPAHALDVVGDGNFTTNLIFGGDIQFGTNPAASGILRLANAQGINFRNAGNTADISAIGVDASNIVNIGDDTNTAALKLHSSTNFVFTSAATTVLSVDSSGNVTPKGAVNGAKVTLASAATVNIGGAAGNYINITGTTAITSFDNVQAGISRVLEFSGALTLTNNANIIVEGGKNYTTAAGDMALAVSEGAGVWRVALFPASGLQVNPSGTIAQMVSSTLAVQQTGTTIFPISGAPISTNGDQYLSQAITPKSATSTLIIDVVLEITNNTGRSYGAGIFQGTTLIAAQGMNSANAGEPAIITMKVKIPSPGTSLTTYTVRAGSNVAGTTTVNSSYNTAAQVSSISITEIYP